MNLILGYHFRPGLASRAAGAGRCSAYWRQRRAVVNRRQTASTPARCRASSPARNPQYGWQRISLLKRRHRCIDRAAAIVAEHHDQLCGEPGGTKLQLASPSGVTELPANGSPGPRSTLGEVEPIRLFEIGR